MIQRMDVTTGHDELSNVAFPGIVPQLGDSPRQISHLGPDLGEHTAEVLSGILNRSDDEIADFIAVTNGAVRG